MKEEEKRLKVNRIFSKKIQRMVNKINKVPKTAISNSILNHAEQIRKATRPLQEANLRMAKTIQANILNEIDFFSKFAQQNETIVQQLIKQQETFNKLHSQHLKAFAGFSQGLYRIQPVISVLQNLQNINIEDFNEISMQTQADESTLANDENELFQKLFIYFRDLILDSSKGRITAAGILQLYLAVITTISFLHSSSISAYEERVIDELEDVNESQQVTNQLLLENINELDNNLYPLIEDLAQTDREEIIFVTKRESIIRTNPTSESEIIDRIPPEQEVEIIKSKKRWYYIKYFDFEKSIPKMGYIYKGNVNSFKH